MSGEMFCQHEDLTDEYRRNFNKPGVVGCYGFEDKTYCLCLDNGKRIVLGKSSDEADKRLQYIYYADQLDFWEPAETIPQFETDIATEQKYEAVKITPKRQELLEKVYKIKKWGRGVIAKIASDLGRKVGAVRQMLSVLTKKGLLVRIRRGEYALSSEQLALI